MNNPRVLGLDLSLNHTGICLIQDTIQSIKSANGKVPWVKIEGYPHCGFHEMNLSSQLSKFARWSLILDAVVYLANRADLVVLEDYAFGARGSAVTGQAEIGGIVRYELEDRSIPFCVVSPSSVKKFLTGSGNAPKDIMLKEVFRRYKLDTNSHNITDAFVLATIGEVMLDPSIKITKDQKIVVSKVLASATQNQAVAELLKSSSGRRVK